MRRRENMEPTRIFIWAGLAALGLTLAVKGFPDFRRYLRIRSM